MFRTIPIKATFNDMEQQYWIYQCEEANSLINCAIYHVRQTHYSELESKGDAFTTYWNGDELLRSWKIYFCGVNYNELDKVLKDNKHYKALAAQSAQQVLKTVGESITSYNSLVQLYYQGEVDRPSLPGYRKKGGLAAVTFPKQALSYDSGYFKPSVSRTCKPDLICDIKLQIPDFINHEQVREVTIRPNYGQLWIDWVIDDGKEPVKKNPNLDYSQAWSFDHGGTNWLTGVSTLGKSFIIDGRKLKSINQNYSRLVAKYKEGKPNFYWDVNLDRIQLKRNNQIRDGINKAARFIVNRALNDGIGNIIIGWNEGQKNGSNMGKRGNQNFVPIPTGRLIERLKQLCSEYGIVLTLTEEAYTSKASFLDNDLVPKYGEKPEKYEFSGIRYPRGQYKTKSGLIVNSDCNGAINIAKKVATQLGLVLTKVSRAALNLPQRCDVFRDLSRKYRRKTLLRADLSHEVTS
ncbi:Transposase, IS605 OrfB [Calothrix sp. PCC 7716]|nr:Transposase, IS605 OrfB [Calothrix sp. PCC 7716]